MTQEDGPALKKARLEPSTRAEEADGGREAQENALDLATDAATTAAAADGPGPSAAEAAVVAAPDPAQPTAAASATEPGVAGTAGAAKQQPVAAAAAGADAVPQHGGYGGAVVAAAGQAAAGGAAAATADGASTPAAAGASGPVAAAPAAAAAEQQGADAMGVPLRAPSPGIAQGKYTAREAQWEALETEGELKFVYVQNDGKPEHSIWLVGLKNVFSKQLPNMPKEYISRLVFDRRHRSVAIVLRNNTVTGGITYRPFHSQHFAEIAFCAVTGPQQVRGFGTRLMNYTKKFAREMDGCEYFLTYADNSAVGYFAKQSFTREISMPKERWHGFIKDYDGGTLMECYIHPHLPFTEFPAMIQAQKRALDSRIRRYTSSHIVYPGIRYWKDGGEDKPPLSIDDIPGVATAGWSAETAALLRPKFRMVLQGTAMEPTPDNLQAFMRSILSRIKKDEDSWPFREPVTEELAPDYFDVIKAPMDLATLERRLEARNFYITLDIFVADMNRIFNNAKIYNSSDTVYYKLAAKLQAQFQQMIHASVIFEDQEA